MVAMMTALVAFLTRVLLFCFSMIKRHVPHLPLKGLALLGLFGLASLWVISAVISLFTDKAETDNPILAIEPPRKPVVIKQTMVVKDATVPPAEPRAKIAEKQVEPAVKKAESALKTAEPAEQAAKPGAKASQTQGVSVLVLPQKEPLLDDRPPKTMIISFPKKTTRTPPPQPDAGLQATFDRARQGILPGLRLGSYLRPLYARPVAQWPKPFIDEGIKFEEMAPLERFDRPRRGSVEAKRVALGRRLFEDPILSGSGQIACQSCHNLRLGWGDGLRTAFGDKRQQGPRNTPPIDSAAYRASLFWDGRAGSLEEQASGPITNPIEMNAKPEKVLKRLNGHTDYPKLFKEAYDVKTITMEDLTLALADFQRQQERTTRFDRFLSGRYGALTDEQIEGLHLFRTKARCMNCHHGPLLADEDFHNLGLTFYGRRLQDLGRYNVTGWFQDVGRFRTPSLRHIMNTAPYMHNGLIPDLRRVIIFYNNGGGNEFPRNEAQRKDPKFPKRSVHMQALNLTEVERKALEAFLEAL